MTKWLAYAFVHHGRVTVSVTEATPLDTVGDGVNHPPAFRLPSGRVVIAYIEKVCDTEEEARAHCAQVLMGIEDDIVAEIRKLQTVKPEAAA